MQPLTKKLLRDIWKMRGQVLAIGFVIASGVGVMVMSLSALASLQDTASAYYDQYRFAEVFAGLERAPNHLGQRIAQIDGVQSVETRITKLALLSVRDFAEPIIGQLVSLPESGNSELNQLALRKGRWLTEGRPDEVIVNEPFAKAHELDVGDQLKAIINGKQRSLTVVGLALTPEYVYAIGPGALMPDDLRFGILWLGRNAMEAAFDLENAFNNVTLTLVRDTNADGIIDRVDTLLERYGGIGAYARKDQISNWFLMNELDQLRSMARILPGIFIAVAAFLTQMVLGRLITTERSEIGLLKAFGYSALQIGAHYMRLVLIIAFIGIVLGWLVGLWLGRINTIIYAEFFSFPLLYFRTNPQMFLISGGISMAAAFIGASSALLRAIQLPPAQAMQPPSPPVFKMNRLSHTRVVQWLDQPTRIITRQLLRWPVRAFLTSFGMALSIGVMIMALQWIDSIRTIIDTYFFTAQRQHITVGLTDTRKMSVLHDIEHLPGVLGTEAARIVSAEFYAGHRFHRGAINGVAADAYLSPIYDNHLGDVAVPDTGLVIDRQLAEKLEVAAGDVIEVQVLEGRRPRLQVLIAKVIDTYIGTPAYMNLDRLNRLLKETGQTEYIHLYTDSLQDPALFARLKEIPAVSAVAVKKGAIDTFENTMAETILIFVSFFTAFASALTFGLVYNSTRITLSERGRELATLRVLGFSRREIAYILLGEIGLLTILSLPMGCIAGYMLAWIITSSFANELYRIPLVIYAPTYGKAMIMILISAALSSMLVGLRMQKLNLISVLKTRE